MICLLGCGTEMLSAITFCLCVSVYLSRMDVADCSTSVYHKVSDQTEVGLSTAYNLHTSNVGLGLVGKYTLNDGAVVKVSFDFVF